MNYYNEIRKNLLNNEVYKKVKDYSKNKSDLDTYYKAGKLLSEAGKHYGEGIIREYSKKLTSKFGKGYSSRNLRNMRQFFITKNQLKWQTVSAKLSWSHFCEILWFNVDKQNYYIQLCINQTLSVRELKNRIKSKEYERLSDETKVKLMKKEKPTIQDLIPNPIMIKNRNNIEVINEKILHQLILENIESFMQELGNYYSFIGSEYKIRIGNSFNYIDLLLYNYEFNSFVVIELKVTELKKEHIGQIQIYMNYIDTNLRRINQDKTIGIIICKKDNKFVMAYCTDERILTREYELL
jgi:predicted nuclease of restriction endonuclease-like (RecB) superfamily